SAFVHRVHVFPAGMNRHKRWIGSFDDKPQSGGFAGARVVTKPVEAFAFSLVGVGPDKCEEILLRGLLVFLLAFREENGSKQQNKEKKEARSFHGLSSLAFRLNFRAAKHTLTSALAATSFLRRFLPEGQRRRRWNRRRRV